MKLQEWVESEVQQHGNGRHMTMEFVDGLIEDFPPEFDRDPIQLRNEDRRKRLTAILAGLQIRRIAAQRKEEGAPQERPTFANQLKLPFEDVLPGWAQRIACSDADVAAVERDMVAWKAAPENAEFALSVEQMMRKARRLAKAL